MSNIKPTRAQLFNGLIKDNLMKKSVRKSTQTKQKLFILIEMLHFSDKIQE